MQILSIDGGGIRGVMEVAYLAELEKQLGTPIYKHFDIITGTSVGAIIAGYLANGGTATDAVSLFSTERINNIFLHNLLNEIVPMEVMLKPKYSGMGKKSVLQEVFGESRLRSVKTKLLIPAYDYIKRDLAVWKSWTGSDSDENPLLSDIIDASSAAPTYFPAVTFGTPARYFIDGGIAANNPSLCALSQYLREGGDIKDVSIFSLGSGVDPNPAIIHKEYAKYSLTWGSLTWLIHGLVDDLLSANISVTDYLAQQLLGERYVRVNPVIPSNIKPAMDATDAINVTALHSLGEAEFANSGQKVLSILKP